MKKKDINVSKGVESFEAKAFEPKKSIGVVKGPSMAAVAVLNAASKHDFLKSFSGASRAVKEEVAKTLGVNLNAPDRNLKIAYLHYHK